MCSNGFKLTRDVGLAWFAKGLLGLCLVFAILKSAVAQSSPAAKQGADELQRWIQELEDSDFATREYAIERIVAMGPDAVEEMSKLLIDGSPESSWRAKRTLERIASAHGGDTMLRVAALLSVKFSKFKYDSFQSKWKTQRRATVVKRLREKGVRLTVQQQFNGLNGPNIVWNQAMLIDQPALVALGNPVVLPQPSYPRPEGNVSKTPGKDEDDRGNSKTDRLLEQFEQLTLEDKFQQILSNDSSQNRILVRQIEQSRESVKAAKASNAFVSHQRQLVEQASLVIDQGFTGDETDFQDLDALSIQSVTFAGIKVSPTLLNAISEHQPRSLIFESCEFEGDGESVEIDRLNSQANVSVAFVKIDEPTRILKSLGMSAIFHLSIQGGRFDESTAAEMVKFPKLSWINLSGLSINEDCFESLGQISKLNALTLNDCQVNLEDIRKFQSSHPNVQITYSASAFLGVGCKDNGDEVKVTQVVPGSAASQAGVKIGDWIQAVESQPIRKFDELRLLISQHRPGDQVRLSIKRGEEDLKLTARLEENLQPVIR